MIQMYLSVIVLVASVNQIFQIGSFFSCIYTEVCVCHKIFMCSHISCVFLYIHVNVFMLFAHVHICLCEATVFK